MRRLLLAVVALLVLGAWWGLPAERAAAHARLITSVPTSHGIVDTSRPEVRLRFNEAVRPVADGFAVYDAEGVRRPAVAVAVDAEVRITLPTDLAEGSYWVSWRVVSGDDHPIGGLVPVGLGQPYQETAPPAAESTEAELTPGRLAAQTLGTVGLLAGAGLFGFAALVTGRRPDGRLLAGAGSAALLGTLATSGVAAPAGLVLLGAFLAVVTPRLGVPARAAWTLGPLVALSSLVVTGHTRTVGPAWLVAGSSLVHVACAALWLGGVLGLGLYLRGARRAQDSATDAAAVVVRFSSVAAGMVVALGISGTVLVTVLLGSPAQLIGSGYGRALLGKLALVAAVAVLAVVNRFWLVPAVSRAAGGAARWRRLRGAIRDEVVLLVAVACASTLLAALPSGQSTQQSGPSSVAVGSTMGTASVRADIAPATVGTNTVDLVVLDSEGAPLTTLSPPRVRATQAEADTPGIDAEVTQIAPGRYRATLPLPSPGDWQLAVWVRLDTYSEPSATWSVAIR